MILRLNPELSRKVWKLAYPIILANLSLTLLNVVDTAMLGRLSPAALAAAGIGEGLGRRSGSDVKMTNILEVKDLCVEIDGRKLLHDLDLTIPDGEVHALLGPNGCGKTTLVMAIMGYPEYKATKGQILFNGENITKLDITERARLGIGISQQRPPTIAGVRLRQILDYVVVNAPQRSQEIDDLAKAFHMNPFLDRDVNASLSGGEIKRSELFQLLVTHPRFAMMDEPDSGIDLEALSLVGNMVNALLSKELDRPAKRRAGLIITHTGHILDYVHADKAHIMLDGRIGCSGNPLILLDKIRKYGYEECIRCILRRREG